MSWFSQVGTCLGDEEWACPWVGLLLIWGSGKNGKWPPQAPEQSNMVLWHLGYSSGYMRMTATLRNQQGSVFAPHSLFPSCLLFSLPAAALPLSASGLLLANVSMGLSFCPYCLRLEWPTEPNFPRTFPVLAPKFLQPGDTWSPGQPGLLVTPTCIPFPCISFIFLKKKEGRSDGVS